MKEAYFEKYFHSIYQEEDHYNKQEHCVTTIEYMCIKALEKKNFVNKLLLSRIDICYNICDYIICALLDLHLCDISHTNVNQYRLLL